MWVKKCPSYVWSFFKMHMSLQYALSLHSLSPVPAPLQGNSRKGQFPGKGVISYRVILMEESIEANIEWGFLAVRDRTLTTTASLSRGLTSGPLAKSFIC